MVSHVLGDGRLTHGNPELHKLAMYSGRTPERIRGGQLSNQGANVWWHAGAPGAMAALPGPEQTKTAPVPRDHGFRLDDLNGRAPAAPRLSHAHNIRSAGVSRRRGRRHRLTTASWCRSAMQVQRGA
jgi:hypothetical protein